MKKSDEQLKLEDLWIKAWCATANANDCKSVHTASLWADRAVYDFQKRFPPVFTPIQDKQPD